MNGFNFTERVRRALAEAREEAVALEHEYVGTEHILLALTRGDTGVAGAVLGEFDVADDTIRQTVLEILKRGPHAVSTRTDLPYTSRGKKVLELAMAEARGLEHNYVGTEHLLLGLLAERNGIAAQVLNSLGLTLERARAATVHILATTDGAPARGAPFAVTVPGYARSRRVHGIALVEDFTGRAREVLRVAYEEAFARASPHVEVAHILLALALRDDGMASVLLDQVTGSRAGLAAALTERLPEKEASGSEHPAPQVAESTQQALDAALLEASKDGHRRAGTQHILLAVVDTLPLSLAAACAQYGVTGAAVRAEYERMRE